MSRAASSPATSARVVWLAMASSLVIYAVVAWTLERVGALPLSDNPPPVLTSVFALVALALAATSMIARSVLVTRGGAHGASAPKFAGMLVGWALCESIAVLGFVHHLLFVRPVISGALLGAALALLVLQAPPRSDG